MLKSTSVFLSRRLWRCGDAFSIRQWSGVSILLAGFLLICSCESVRMREAPEAGGDAQRSIEKQVEAISLLGHPLYQRRALEKQTTALASELELFSNKKVPAEGDYVELGARYAAAGRYRDAIEIYSQGIKSYPASYKLRRHRGHRLLTLRRLDDARRDLDEAISLMPDAATSPSVELKAGKANGTYQHWILYHKGIVAHLSGEYQAAADTFGKSLDTAGDNDRLIGAVDWLYQSYQKDGNRAAAQYALNRVSRDIAADKSKPYYKRVMIYKGLSSYEEAIDLNKDPSDWTAFDVTVGYGIASWLRFNGDAGAADKIYDTILQSQYWQIWAYLAAESDIALGREAASGK